MLPPQVPQSDAHEHLDSPASQVPFPHDKRFSHTAVHLPAPAQTSVVCETESSHEEFEVHKGLQELLLHAALHVPEFTHVSLVKGFESSQSAEFEHATLHDVLRQKELHVPALLQESVVISIPSLHCTFELH